jgi:hypothetical protein
MLLNQDILYLEEAIASSVMERRDDVAHVARQ